MDFRFVFLIFFFLLSSSCKNNDKELQASIVGTWDVYLSKMNNKPNGFMKNGYFVFEDDSLVTSNIFPDNQKPKYFVENERLLIDLDEKIELKISKLVSDSLNLEGKLSFYYMEYFLVRRK